MARKNKLGNSFMGLDLDPSHEKRLKEHLKKKDVSARQFIRFLIRNFFNEQTDENYNKQSK